MVEETIYFTFGEGAETITDVYVDGGAKVFLEEVREGHELVEVFRVEQSGREGDEGSRRGEGKGEEERGGKRESGWVGGAVGGSEAGSKGSWGIP